MHTSASAPLPLSHRRPERQGFPKYCRVGFSRLSSEPSHPTAAVSLHRPSAASGVTDRPCPGAARPRSPCAVGAGAEQHDPLDALAISLIERGAEVFQDRIVGRPGGHWASPSTIRLMAQPRADRERRHVRPQAAGRGGRPATSRISASTVAKWSCQRVGRHDSRRPSCAARRGESGLA